MANVADKKEFKVGNNSNCNSVVVENGKVIEVYYNCDYTIKGIYNTGGHFCSSRDDEEFYKNAIDILDRILNEDENVFTEIIDSIKLTDIDVLDICMSILKNYILEYKNTINKLQQKIDNLSVMYKKCSDAF